MKIETKQLTLLISVLGSLIAYALFHSRETGLCNFYCGDLINQTQNAFLTFIPALFFICLIYKLPKQYFLTWWRFAKYAMPLVFLLSLLISSGILHSSSGTWQDMLDFPVLILLNGIFVVGSLIQIIRGYFQK